MSPAGSEAITAPQGPGTVKTIVVLGAGIIAVSCAAIFIRLCDDVPSLVIAAFRLGIASLALLAFTALKGDTPWRIARRDMLLSLAAGIFLALHFITWISSLKYTSVASSVVIVTTNPVFVAIFSFLFLKERQPAELISGAVLCVAGSALIALGDGGIAGLAAAGSRADTGDALALAGAVAGSGYIIAGSRVRERIDTIPFITIVFTIAAVILLAVCLALGTPFGGYRSSSYFFMVLLALVPQLIGHTAFIWALGHLRAGMVAVTILGEPVGATILAWFIFGETVGAVQFAGMMLIFSAIVITSRKGGKVPS